MKNCHKQHTHKLHPRVFPAGIRRPTAITQLVLGSPLSLPLLLAGLLKVLRPSPPHPAIDVLRRDSDTELGRHCCVPLRMKEADREAVWSLLPAPLLPAYMDGG